MYWFFYCFVHFFFYRYPSWAPVPALVSFDMTCIYARILCGKVKFCLARLRTLRSVFHVYGFFWPVMFTASAYVDPGLCKENLIFPRWIPFTNLIRIFRTNPQIYVLAFITGPGTGISVLYELHRWLCFVPVLEPVRLG
jgi:hypothetical protein